MATRCCILKLKCIKFDFGLGSAPDPAGGSYTAPPDPLAGFKDPTSKGRKGRVEEGCPVFSVQFIMWQPYIAPLGRSKFTRRHNFDEISQSVGDVSGYLCLRPEIS